MYLVDHLASYVSKSNHEAKADFKKERGKKLLHKCSFKFGMEDELQHEEVVMDSCMLSM